jgi:hypothetical protein
MHFLRKASSCLAMKNVDLARLEMTAPPRVTDLAPCVSNI